MYKLLVINILHNRVAFSKANSQQLVKEPT